jgi:uncharacterized membrane-anchored protein
MNRVIEPRTSKAPEVTLTFWPRRLSAKRLSTAIFFAIFVVTVAAQVRAKSFHPFLYWSVIVATTTAGTTMADYVDRSPGIGYIGGSLLLFALLLLVLGSRRAPYRSQTSRRPRWKYSTGRRFSSRTRLEPLLAIFSPMIQG